MTANVRTSSFDRVILVSISLLVLAIVITILIGDRVGVRLVRVFPLEEAHSTDDILIQFSEPMNRESVESLLTVEPEIEGAFSWSSDTLIFRPEEPMRTGDTFTVTLEAGAQSRSGREVLRSYQYNFTVRPPYVAYLAPADSSPQNIWLTNPAEPDSAEQVTFSDSGVFDFDVSPDGRRIAFAERRTDRPAADIKLLDLDTGRVQPLTNCEDADCTSPAWRPDGNTIAYTRVEFNSLLPNVGVSPQRVWLLDLTTNPPSTRPLFEDSQVLGYGPQWSYDGTTLALFDNSLPGIIRYDFEDQVIDEIPSEHGSAGSLSPDGEQLVFPQLVFSDSRARSQLMLADVPSQEITPISRNEEPSDDDFAVWHPDGDMLVIGRRYWDDRYTRGLQVYTVDVETGETEPLIVDEQYTHGFLRFDPNGDMLVMQRFRQLDENGEVDTSAKPEIWTYALDTGELTRIAVNAFFPRWAP